jgi:hypothetical protein
VPSERFETDPESLAQIPTRSTSLNVTLIAALVIELGDAVAGVIGVESVFSRMPPFFKEESMKSCEAAGRQFRSDNQLL